MTPFDTVGVVTCGRPALARRAVLGLADNAVRYRRTVEILLFDDSPSDGARRQNRTALREAAERPGVVARYAGPDEKARYIECLQRQTGVTEPILAFLLAPANGLFSAGANRNLLLLETAGRCLLTIDDDVTAAVTRSPAYTEGIRWLPAGRYPNDVWFFENRQAALDAVSAEDADVLGTMQRWLGAAVRGGDGVRVVRLCQAGIAGDSGVASPVVYLGLNGPSRSRLVHSEASFRRAVTSREVLAVASQVSVGDPSLVMPGALALDNRTLLPPFFPRYRNENAVFGLTLAACWKTAATAHLPFALWHLPEDTRRFAAEAAWADGTLFRVCDAIAAMVQAAVPGLRDVEPGERLDALGDALASNGRRPPRAFAEALSVQHRGTVRRRAATFERLLVAYRHAPKYWADAVARYVERLRTGANAAGAMVPRELRGTPPDQACADLLALTVLFGRALLAWRRIVAGAVALRESGVRVTSGA